ncbi:MAG: hypothetical protein PHG07_08080 [Lachnospiraceae bacterium]|nr:hypothetical protein [Lachnospiraceae bacterium]
MSFGKNQCIEDFENIRLLKLVEERDTSGITTFESLVAEDGFSMEEIEELAKCVEFD